MDSTDVTVQVVEPAPGVKLNVRSWASAGRGRPFVLVHGLSSNARLWDAVARELVAAGHEAHAVDLRSHGDSPSTTDGHSTATAAADVSGVITALGLPPVLLAGQSWGGNVVVRLAAHHPAQVAGLALVDGGWIDLSADFASWPECEAALRPPEIDGLPTDDIRGYLRTAHPDWSAEALEATLANLRQRPDDTVERRLPIPAHMDIVRSMWEAPPWPDLERIAVPALLLPAVPSDPEGSARRRGQLERALKSLAKGQLREYVGGDHDLHAQQPAAVAADLLTLAGEAG